MELALSYVRVLRQALDILPLRETEQVGDVLFEAYQEDKTVYLFGNGGSAADAQHLAADLVVKLHRQRIALPPVPLTANPSVLTAIANDNCFQEVFARQVEALVRPSDILIGISTSGNSENVLRALQMGIDKEGSRGWMNG